MYITSYLHSYDASVTVNQVHFFLTIQAVVNGLSIVLSVKLVDQIGPKLTNLVGVLAMVLAYAAAAYLTELWLFVVVFGLLLGAGTGINFMTGTNVALRHFTLNRGKALGLCASGLGFGTVLFGLLFTFIVNPHNALPDIASQDGAQTVYYFSPDISGRVPLAFLASALAAVCLGVTGSLLMRVKEVPAVQFTDSNEEDMLSHKGDEEPLTTVGQALRQPKFWKMFGALYCGQSFCVWVFCSYKSFGSLYFSDDHFLSYVGAAGAILNGVSRGAFPCLLDYIGFFTMNRCTLSIEAFLAFSLYSSVHSEFAYVTAVATVFFIQGSQFFPFSLLCLNEYGPVLGPKVFSYVALGATIANGMPGVYYWLTVKNFGYFSSYFIQGMQCIVGLLLSYSLSQDVKKVATKHNFA
jgi:hypothetical protein